MAIKSMLQRSMHTGFTRIHSPPARIVMQSLHSSFAVLSFFGSGSATVNREASDTRRAAQAGFARRALTRMHASVRRAPAPAAAADLHLKTLAADLLSRG